MDSPHPDDISNAAAFLFPNGNAMFFDADGEQMNEHQKHGWRGLHDYLDDHPEADVVFAVWDNGAPRPVVFMDEERAVENIAEPDPDDAPDT